ncbi:MAG: hypothetical protein H7Y38_12700, partial [Armatimonadetes bacterium]|nr:hypothetical protein [Armatimonadota bacterium]
ELVKQKEFVKFFTDFSANLIVYGSQDLIEVYSEWRSSSGKVSGEQNLLNLEKVLFQIRKDLGNDNSQLQPGNLVQMFLTDDAQDLVFRAKNQQEQAKELLERERIKAR